VRDPLAALVLLILTTAPAGVAAAQARWRPEIGIQGGFARIKPTGTGLPDQIDVWDGPGDGTSYPTVFAIIPVVGRLAIEPSISASQQSIGGEVNGVIGFTATSRVGLTVRGNVALAGGLYAAAGGMLRFSESGAGPATRLGLVVGMGYRVARGGVTARVEAQGVALPRSDRFGPTNLYALLLGISKRSGSGAASDSGRDLGARPWRLALGAAGGYVRSHARGTVVGRSVKVDQTWLALPGSAAATPPTLYAIVPLRGRLALELGIDAHRTAANDTASFTAQLAPRIDIALHGGWYAAAGASLRYVEQTGAKGLGFVGANVAAGYRFPLTAVVGGRVEMSYIALKERRDVPLAQNIVAVTFGVTMAVK